MQRLRPQDVLDSLAAHIAVLDEAGVIAAVNRPWRDFATANGVAPAIVCEGANYLQVCDEASGQGAEAASAVARGIRDVLAGRCVEFLQEYPCHAPGRERWFVVRVTRLNVEGPPRAIVSHEDVTEQKQAERALRESEENFRLLLDSTGEAIYGVDMDGRCTFCNAACLRLLGYAESRDLLGKNMHWQIHHSRADGSTLLVEECRIFQAFRKGEGTHVVDEVLWRADGTSFPVEYWSYPVRKGEQVVGAVVTFVDISERKRAVEALRQSQERLWLALDAGRMGAWDWDIRTDKLVCSQNMEEVLQVAPGSFDGTFQAFQRLIHPVDRERVEDAITRSLEEWSNLEVEFRVVRSDGSIGWLAGRGRGFPGPDGQPERMVGISVDITERRRAQEEIFVLNAELEGRLGRIRALREIDRAITGSLDLRFTLGVVLDQALGQLEIDAAAVLLCRPHEASLEYAVHRGFHRPPPADFAQRLDEGPAGRAILECRTQHLAASSGVPSTLPEPAGPRGSSPTGPCRWWPRARSRACWRSSTARRWTPSPEWLEFLEALAGQAAIAIDNAALFEDLRRSNLELTLAYDATIEGWSRALDLRDKETEGHSQRVTEMTLRLARAMGMGEAELVHIRRGALLHDIGKMGIPDAILLKPGPLTDEEWGHAPASGRYASRCSRRSPSSARRWTSRTVTTRSGTAPATRAG